TQRFHYTTLFRSSGQDRTRKQTEQSMRILLAEDDQSQADSIQTWLEMAGSVIDRVERGDHAILAFEQHQYDCILLDRGLPNATRDESLTSLRSQQQDTTVILITAKDSINDRVEGLDLGANDYLVKPFSLEELSARVRAQLRQKQQTPNHILLWQDLSLDTQAKNLTKAGQAINLTAKEFQILYKLMQQPEHIVTREQLEESLYAKIGRAHV